MGHWGKCPLDFQRLFQLGLELQKSSKFDRLLFETYLYSATASVTI